MNEDNNIEICPETQPEAETTQQTATTGTFSSFTRDWEQIKAKEQADGIKFFGTMAVPCLIFAVVFAVCLFQNAGGITTPVWVASVIALTVYALGKFERKLQRNSYFVIAVMLLISVSSFLTGSEDIQTLNIMALFMLTVYLVLMNFADTAGWDLGKHFCEMIVAVFSSIGYLLKPFSEASAYVKSNADDSNGRSGNGRQILIGALIAVPCLVILGALLGSADMVFADLLDRFFEKFSMPEKVLGMLLLAVFGFFAAYCGLHYAWSRGDKITVTPHRNAEPVVAITVNASIAVLYLIFSVIQIMYLFIGNFELPDGVTYAEYAREGFFQLLFVCIINMLLVLAMKKYVKRSRGLDIILIVICACTYIMIASSACRMIMYIQAYELTMLRVIVLFALFALAFLMAGVIISIVNESFRFFNYGLAVVCIVYLGLAFSRPDVYIAKYNLNNAYSPTKEYKGVDFSYISQLSTDAAPVIDEYLRENGLYNGSDSCPEWVNRYKYFISDSMETAGHLRKFNVSVHRASRLYWTK